MTSPSATHVLSKAVHLLQIITARSGSCHGRGRRSTASTTLKIAALAPMPSASVAIATAVKPAFRRSVRLPNLRSCQNVSMNVDACIRSFDGFALPEVCSRRPASGEDAPRRRFPGMAAYNVPTRPQGLVTKKAPSGRARLSLTTRSRSDSSILACRPMRSPSASARQRGVIKLVV